jgi:hypothetical protein
MSHIDRIFIDSSDNSNASQSHNDVHITLPRSILLHENCKLKLENFNVANTFYNVISGANTFLVNATTITLPIGYYTSGSLISAIQSQLTAIHANFNVSLSTLTYKITILRTDATNFTMTFNNSFKERLGFTGSSYSGAASYVSENVPSFTDNEFFVRVSGSGIGQNLLTSNSSNHPSFIIPINADVPYVINYTSNNDFEQTISASDNIHALTFVLTDKERRLLSGVGNWSMVLSIIRN